MRALLCIAAVAPSAIAAPGAASADPGDELGLVWQAPAGCPDAATVRAQITAAAGGADQARGAARATARPLGGAWVVEIDVGDGPRTLRGDRCDEVARAAALVIGIALRTAAERPEPGAQDPDGEVPWRDPGIDRAAIEARVERRPPVPWRPSIAVQAGAAIGALPEPGPVARVGLAAQRGMLLLRAEALVASAGRSVLLDEDVEADVRVDLAAATASTCYAAAWLWLCGGLEAGAMRAIASAGEARVDGAGLWLAGHAGPSAILRLSRALHLVLEAEGVVPLSYPTFSVNGVSLPASLPVSIRTEAGIRVAFP